MAADLIKITAALNAYPWTAGTLTQCDAGVPRYCAVGLLLRYAGVPQDQLAGASDSEAWARHRALLQAEYGIEGFHTVALIVGANDSARSHADAIERVQGILSGEFTPVDWARQNFGTECLIDPPGTEAWHPEDRADEGGASPALI
jgi:hypothetical protein